jgi:hypothetical protein
MESIGDIFEIRKDGIAMLNKHNKKVKKFKINT